MASLPGWRHPCRCGFLPVALAGGVCACTQQRGVKGFHGSEVFRRRLREGALL